MIVNSVIDGMAAMKPVQAAQRTTELLQAREVSAAKKATEPVSVGGASASDGTRMTSRKTEGVYGAGATDGARSAWEPVSNLEILDMSSVFLEMRSVPLEQGPSFISKYLEDLTQIMGAKSA